MKPSNVSDKPMTLEEARKVRWNRQNPRPMGELLDEGSLTQGDLIWAAERAFNPRQRQAARILLDDLERAPRQPPHESESVPMPPELANSQFSIGLTMEQIRATLWPFAPYAGQTMGKLADRQQLSLKDLGYAADNARDQRVRQAAVALLLVRLNQVVMEPPSSAGPLHVVSGGRSFAERRQFLWVMVEAGLLGGIEGAAVASLFYLLFGRPPAPTSAPSLQTFMNPTGIIAILIVVGSLLGLLLLGKVTLDFVISRIEKQIQHYRKGQEGEERTLGLMQSVLDGNWFLFRNIELPGRNKADLDSVLIGPSGVWVVEIKNYTGEYRNTCEVWEYRTRNRWTPIKKSPSRQAQNNAVRLNNFLKADGIQQYVEPAVVWANPEAALQVENPSVAVWTLEHLPDELDNIWQHKPLPEEKRQQIVDKLTKLCEAQRKEAEK